MKQNSKDKNNKKLVIEIAKTDTKEIVMSLFCQMSAYFGRKITDQPAACLFD